MLQRQPKLRVLREALSKFDAARQTPIQDMRGGL
jgi:hypothetical protein